MPLAVTIDFAMWIVSPVANIVVFSGFITSKPFNFFIKEKKYT